MKKNKKLLIKYLSLLLKYDWERSKKEISDITRSIYIFTTLNFLLLFLVVLFNFGNFGEILKNNFIGLVIGGLVGFIIKGRYIDKKNKEEFEVIKKNYTDTVMYLDKQLRVDKCRGELKKIKDDLDETCNEISLKICHINKYLEKLVEKYNGEESKSTEEISYFEYFMSEFIISYLEQNKDIKKLELIEQIIRKFDEIKKLDKLNNSET